MTKINARIIAASEANNHKIATMEVTFPRFILAELNTHRMFSRNSASSRAIPFAKMVESVKTNPFIPIAWQIDHKGMQGTEYFTDITEIQLLEQNHLLARDSAILRAETANEIGLTKQICNRYLEPFMWHTVLISATEYENFFELRCPKYEVSYTTDNGNIEAKYFRSWKDLVKFHFDFFKANRDVIEELENASTLTRLHVNVGQAEIHMMALAEAMWDAYNEAKFKPLKEGEWHIPFEDSINNDNFTKFKMDLWKNKQAPTDGHNDLMVKISTAMCARVSYTVVGEEGKEPNYENDTKLHDRLSKSGHASPFEHIAQCMTNDEYNSRLYNKGGEHGWSRNFRGFKQYRETINL